MVELPANYLDLIDGPVVVFLATVQPDGFPQVTPVWCNRQGNEIWINSAKGRQKDRNMRDRPIVTIAATDPKNSYRWIEIRGKVSEVVEGPEAHQHIADLSMLYIGRLFEYPADQERVIYKITPLKVNVSD